VSAPHGLISESSKPTLVDAENVGGKASSLFRLQASGFNVPPFFVICADAYRRTSDGTLDAEMRIWITDAFAALGGEAYDYAVRSSGVAEDSADHSYAGVFDTFLNVHGVSAVTAAVEQCFESHRSARASAYRLARAVAEDPAMAVVVQRMVSADWAGVSFSADPLAQALSVMVINASAGLGEDLVSGRVNPEEIRLDIATGAVLEHRVPPNAQMLPESMRKDIAELTLRVADKFGFPQDLEWAVEGKTLFVLQSRPVTTLTGVFHNRALEPWAATGRPDAPERVWTRAYADEVWTPPVTPLFYDLQNLTGVTKGRLRNDGDTQPIPPDIFKYYRAAPYLDASVLFRLYSGLPKIARRNSLLALFPPELREPLLRAPWRASSWLRRAWRFEVIDGRRFGITRNHRRLELSWPAFLTGARHLSVRDLSALSEAQLDSHIEDTWALAGSVAPECEVAVLYYAHDLKLVLSGLLDRWCGLGDQRYGEVSRGLANSETVRESDALWSMANAICAAGSDAVERAKSVSLAEFRAAADEVKAGDAVRKFDSFLREHRHRGASYKDFIYPRWGDDPELLWSHVKAFLDSQSKRPLDVNEAGAAGRRAAQTAALQELGGVLAPLKRRVLRALFTLNEIYAGIRDNHRFYYDYIWWLVRRAYLEMGRRLQIKARLNVADDIFFLVRSEIDGLRRDTLSTEAAEVRIHVRRREWLDTKVTQPPKFLRNGYVPDASEQSHAAGPQDLKGLAASSGQVTGRARVLHDVAELSRLREGEILVARQTDPGWTPAFARIGGLVLETGGVLAHGASLCREYGLPCVTAVESAASIIRDGDCVLLDGGSGLVRVLESSPVVI
jgi:rifampicin phosphotransferase